ncbi:hypothetical protein D3C86_1788100 [compost metagenome]
MFLPMLPPTTISGCLSFSKRKRSAITSTPLLLKPIRLIKASSFGKRNMRGLSFPGCGIGVTVPTSIKPKPRLLNASTYSPFLSKPAAKPTGFLNFTPKTSFSRPLMCTSKLLRIMVLPKGNLSLNHFNRFTTK